MGGMGKGVNSVKAAFHFGGSAHNGFSRLDQTQTGSSAPESRPRWAPEETAGFLSHVFFSYCNGLVRMGYSRPLEHDELWDVAARDDAAAVSGRFQAALASTVDPVKHPQAEAAGEALKAREAAANKRKTRAQGAAQDQAAAEPEWLQQALVRLLAEQAAKQSAAPALGGGAPAAADEPLAPVARTTRAASRLLAVAGEAAGASSSSGGGGGSGMDTVEEALVSPR
ncbi:hypothetical protein TSOC_009131 [Tetrabaena socialis]|uniref:Uncharacterized protein n=1 Tax=Tetrabaena socialis TaxID=47790 RepID=A0A2J7ZWR7_9CHLO|nr:hypothetical protein TSOC_009131 [Tetrabaena socialis]|eukprot:PNH04685.1 hypothetical protein TSOC_009131 [Tetrabaena socialis]